MKRYRLRFTDKSTGAQMYVHIDANNPIEAKARLQKLFMRLMDEPLTLVEEPIEPGVCCK